jgi:hypoxanthine phosphoribosyltransferase
MPTIFVKDKEFRISITANQINRTVQKIADQINLDYKGKNPLFLPVLNGSFIFAADLLRKITIPCQVSFVKFASYSGTSTTANVKELIGINEEVRARNVIILEDIVDTGITIDLLLNQLKKYEPADVKIACFCRKPEAFVKSFRIDYCGLEIPNEFVVGYGLDYDGYGRNLPDIYKVAKKRNGEIAK